MPSSRPLTLGRGLAGTLALAAGVTVANIYYNQPLLELLTREFHVTASAAGTVAVATQLGYATGLLLLVPLGDAIERRRLIVGSAAAAAAMLLALSFAPSLPVLIGGSYLLGILSVTPQFIVPYAAAQAAPTNRGKVVGVVMSGLLIGILSARAAAGFAAGVFGWRGVFVGGALCCGATALLLLRIPPAPVARPLPYGELLRSLPGLLRREPVLRRHAVIGALGFAAFSAFWTTLGFYLAARPEHFGSRVVGLFGLVAIAGALVAPIAGRLSDRLSARVVNGTSLVLIVLSFLLMAGADRSLVVLVGAVFLMDAGVQANQISNQTRIYALAPELRNRITSVYMVVYFLGGAVGSALGARAWATWGWTGVWGTGAALASLALLPLFLVRVPADAVAGSRVRATP